MVERTYQLEPIEPEAALEQYLTDKGAECSPKTIYNYRSELQYFLQYCDENSIESMHELSGRDVNGYRLWREAMDEFAPIYKQQQVRKLRTFLTWCEDFDYVADGLHDKVIIPSISDEDKRSDTEIEPERMQEVIDHLTKFEWASSRCTVAYLLWRTGARIGSIHSLDLGDWDAQRRVLEFRHRPPETRLKLEEKGERNVTIVEDELAECLSDYVAQNRDDVTDDAGRDPLITTTNGRMHQNTMRKLVYAITRPCIYRNECPHGRDQDECEATVYEKAMKCPSSISPHPIRRASISFFLDRDVPKEIVSERMAVSVDTIEKHYDQRDHEQKRQRRAKYLDGV